MASHTKQIFWEIIRNEIEPAIILWPIGEELSNLCDTILISTLNWVNKNGCSQQSKTTQANRYHFYNNVITCFIIKTFLDSKTSKSQTRNNEEW